MSFRAPHRPYSHNMTLAERSQFMPYAIKGKSGEQIGLLDRYIGQIMKTLHDLKIAENTLVLFTSDNGPDTSAYKLFNKLGQIRMGTMRGGKHAIYEGTIVTIIIIIMNYSYYYCYYYYYYHYYQVDTECRC